jgi:hypothetical protein
MRQKKVKLLKKNLTRGNLELLTRIRNLYGTGTENIKSFKGLARVAKRFYKQGLLKGYIQKNPQIPKQPIEAGKEIV